MLNTDDLFENKRKFACPINKCELLAQDCTSAQGTQEQNYIQLNEVPSTTSETLGSENGKFYKGIQSETVDGTECANWSTLDTPLYGPYQENNNFCRNAAASGATIWCYTKSDKSEWGYCDPIQSKDYNVRTK